MVDERDAGEQVVLGCNDMETTMDWNLSVLWLYILLYAVKQYVGDGVCRKG